MKNAADHPLSLKAGHHQLTSTAQTPEPEIRTDAKNKPAPFSARMRFFHHKNVVYCNIHPDLPLHIARCAPIE